MYDAHGRPIGATTRNPKDCGCTRHPEPRASVAVPVARIVATGLVLAAIVLAVGQVVSAVVAAVASTSVVGLALHVLTTSRHRD